MNELERLRELIDINRIISGSLDFDEVLQRVVEKTYAFTGAKVFLLLTDAAGLASVSASRGVAPLQASGFRAPLDERVGTALITFLGLGADMDFRGVPVVNVEGLCGILAIIRPVEQAAPPDEEWFLAALADQAGIALQHADLHRKTLLSLQAHEDLNRKLEAESISHKQAEEADLARVFRTQNQAAFRCS